MSSLDEAISLLRDAVEAYPESNRYRSDLLSNLSATLGTRFGLTGQHLDLREAMTRFRDVHGLAYTDDGEEATQLFSLATKLLQQVQQSCQMTDLETSISLFREGLALLPFQHPSRSPGLNNLGLALITRFDQSVQREDLEEAISFHREALELQAAPHPHRSSSLSNLASALTTRFDRSGQRGDLDSAISFHREALELQAAPHPHRSNSLNNLANALITRFYQSGQREDLDSAISFHREALELSPAPHPHRSSSLNNLAIALSTRFNQSGQREDLHKAISMFYEARHELISGHPNICSYSNNLGQTLMNAYSTTKESQYLDEAVAAFRMAVTCEAGPTSLRFHVAKAWARHADARHKSALDAYQAAIDLLPRLAMLGLNLQSHQHVLTSGADGLARNAAACAIRSGQYDKAIELLEEGRAIFASQALRLRTPMMDLRDVAPKLEEKLRQISLALEQGLLRDASRHLSDNPQKVISMEKEASHFRCLNDEWLATLGQVRSLDGFQDFMRPSRLSTLQDAVVNGPVVILNASEAGCAALVLTLNGVQHVPIPDLSSHQVTILVKLIRNAIAQGGGYPLLPDSNRAHVQGLVEQVPHIGRASDISTRPDDIFRYVLGILWTSVVGPVIRLLKLEVNSF
jgi:tetratricopeptide (TPR) repeat protein